MNLSVWLYFNNVKPMANVQALYRQSPRMHTYTKAIIKDEWLYTYSDSTHTGVDRCVVSVPLLPWLSERCPLLLQLWFSQFLTYKWWTHHCDTCCHCRQNKQTCSTHKDSTVQYSDTPVSIHLYITRRVILYNMEEKCMCVCVCVYYTIVSKYCVYHASIKLHNLYRYSYTYTHLPACIT